MSISANSSKVDDEGDFLLELGQSLLSVVVPIDYNERPSTKALSTASTTSRDSSSVETCTSQSHTSLPGLGIDSAKPCFSSTPSMHWSPSSYCPLSEVPPNLCCDALKALTSTLCLPPGLHIEHNCDKARSRSMGGSTPPRVKKGDNPPRGVWRNRGGYIAAIYVQRERVYAPLRKTVQEAVRDRAALEKARLVYPTKESLKRFVNTVLRHDHYRSFPQ